MKKLPCLLCLMISILLAGCGNENVDSDIDVEIEVAGDSVTNGYAQPDTCFLFAYDLSNDKLLWRRTFDEGDVRMFIDTGFLKK